MRAILVLGLLLQATSVWGCRVVCSKGNTLWHLLRDSETSDTFQVLQDSETVNTGLRCHLLTPSGTDQEREEQRLINLCSLPPDETGKQVVFRSERVQRKQIRVAEEKAVEEKLEQLVWTWEEHRTDPATGKKEIKVTRQVEMDRQDCGSSAER